LIHAAQPTSFFYVFLFLFFYRSCFTLWIMAFLSCLRLVGLVSLLSLQALALVLHDQLAGVPAGWSAASTPSDDAQMVLQIALTLQNLDELESKLASISTPGSPSYGQYLDLDEVNAMFGASEASSAAVKSWLKSSGVTKYKTQGDSVWFQSTVAQANSMLGTTFRNYIDSTGVTKLRTTKYSIPASLVGHVDLVSPTTYFGKTKGMRAIQAAKTKPLAARTLPASCNTSILYENETFPAFVPDCLQIEYNINGYTPDANSGSRIAFGSFLNQSASFSDLTLFEQYFDIPIQT
jgi:tripeptidyl-peptidase-1